MSTLLDQYMTKAPNARLDYSWSWVGWLSENETIKSASVTVPDGLGLALVTQLNGVVSAVMFGGKSGIEYKVSCKIITSLGREDTRFIYILCLQR